MRLQQIIGGLTPAEKSAIKVLDESGRWSVLYDARIDDGWNADGQKRRTFQRRGRCHLVLMLDTEAKNPATGLFAEPEAIPEPQPVAVQADPVEIAPAPEPPEMKHTRPVPWVEEPFVEQAPEPEPPAIEEAEVEVYEIEETETLTDADFEDEPEHKAARSHHKPKVVVKKKKKK